MKNYDNTIQYYELLMYYSDTSKYIDYPLPEGYHWEFYHENDEYDWVKIHISTGEFSSIERGLEIFHTFFDSFKEKLDKRCFFIVENTTNQKVGTATISALQKPEFGFYAACDWLAIHKDYQGKGLAKPLVSKMIQVAHQLGHKEVILHTQTTTWLAAKIYLDYGFEILNKEERKGWSILRTLTNHEKLKEYDLLDSKDILDKRNMEIERQLREIYQSDDFNYDVIVKNGLHNVYTCFKNTYQEYEFFIENEKVILKKVKDFKYKA